MCSYAPDAACDGRNGSNIMPHVCSSPSPSEWDAQYRLGRWSYLRNVAESGHYAVIAGYARKYLSRGRVLDVACGEGVLYDYLHPASVGQYVGIDCSRTAIERFADRCTGLDLSCTTIEQYDPGQNFDGIIFNEILYYLAEPIQTLLRYSRFLTESGILIVSMYCHEHDIARGCSTAVGSIWQEIDGGPWALLDETKVSSMLHQRSWIIRALRPGSPR